MIASKPLREAWKEFMRERQWLSTRARGHSWFGFKAGWHARKIAELDVALQTPAARTFGKGWKRERDEELCDAATVANLEGRNWFRDSSGKIWVDVPKGATHFAMPSDRFLTPEETRRIYEFTYWRGRDVQRILDELEEFEMGLDAGIPIG